MKPEFEWKRADGSTIRIWRTEEPHKFRAEIDGKPYDPTSRFEDALDKGQIKKK